MHNQKKGAIELSITTIVVIVIGVTLLALGLVWVKNVFGGINSLTQFSLDIARGEIDKTSRTEEITVAPETFSVDKESYTSIKLYVSNLGDSPATFKAKLNPSEGLDANFADTNEKESTDYKLEIGEEVGIQIYVLATSKAKLGPTGLSIEVSSDNWDEPKLRSAVVNVKKKSGIF